MRLDASSQPRSELRRVVWVSSLGTIFEWYDFFLYVVLSDVLARHFFPASSELPAYLTYVVFVVGFAVRPLGAVVFGRLGDLIGRKHSLTLSVLVMALAACMVGILPGYASVGIASPLLLVLLRMQQGLAMGGEYSGAAVYVAEFAPRGRLGRYTGFVQSTATLGLLSSMGVVWFLRWWMGEAAFVEWGWRLPFLGSGLLLGISLYLRFNLRETPAFTALKGRGGLSSAPLTEAFADGRYLRKGLLALFGLTAGQAVVWYTAHVYVPLYLVQTLNLPSQWALPLFMLCLALSAPLFVLVGGLSDIWGRKPFVLGGLLLATLTYLPVFDRLAYAVNPQAYAAHSTSPVVLAMPKGSCATFFGATEPHAGESACRVAQRVLSTGGVSYSHRTVSAEAGVWVGDHWVPAAQGAQGPSEVPSGRAWRFERDLSQALSHAGYTRSADLARIHWPLAVALVLYCLCLAALVYGPLAAMLVEMFPTRIRQTAASWPYQVGNGWFGGALPIVASGLTVLIGTASAGLWFPMGVALMSFVITAFWVPETFAVDILAADG